MRTDISDGLLDIPDELSDIPDSLSEITRKVAGHP
jgi:hypothetical protein